MKIGYSRRIKNRKCCPLDRMGMDIILRDMDYASEPTRALQQVTNMAEKGDEITVPSFLHLAGNLRNLIERIEAFFAKGARVIFIRESVCLKMGDPTSDAFMNGLKSATIFENRIKKTLEKKLVDPDDIIVDKVKRGRPRKLNSDKMKKVSILIQEGYNLTEIAKALGVTRVTLQNYVTKCGWASRRNFLKGEVDKTDKVIKAVRFGPKLTKEIVNEIAEKFK